MKLIWEEQPDGVLRAKGREGVLFSIEQKSLGSAEYLATAVNTEKGKRLGKSYTETLAEAKTWCAEFI